MKRHVQSCLRGCIGLLFVSLPYVVAAPADSAADFGRLFTSPAERAEIDRMRASFRPEAAVSADAGESLSPVGIAPQASMRLNGIMRRSDGHDELWLNGGRAATGGDPDAQNRVRVRVPGTDRMVWMKPGQVLDTSTGVVRESYQGGRTGP